MDTTLASFEKDVIEASIQTPVLVDFWAPWCEPCKSLGPMLEKLESEFAGRWKLAKVNSEENPELTEHFQIRSIPHVVAFVDGRAVDQFVGVLPESDLRAFLNRLVPDHSEMERRAAAHALAHGDRQEAIDRLEAALALDPGSDAARLDLIDLLLGDDKLDDVRKEMALLSPKVTQGLDDRFNALKTALDAAEQAAALPDTASLAQRIEADGNDLDARFDLASKMIARRDYDAALLQLLEIVKRDRAYRDDIGRKTMLSVFQLAVDDPALVAGWRRRLSAALY